MTRRKIRVSFPSLSKIGSEGGNLEGKVDVKGPARDVSHLNSKKGCGRFHYIQK